MPDTSIDPTNSTTAPTVGGDDSWAETWVTDLGVNPNASTVAISSTTGNDITIPLSTTTKAGVVSAIDKTKIIALPNTWSDTLEYSILNTIVSLDSRIYRSRLTANNINKRPAAGGTNAFWEEVWVTDLGIVINATTVDISSTTGDDITILEATQIESWCYVKCRQNED